MKKLNKYIAIGICTLSLMTSCADYLDIVPDKTQEMELLFNRKEQAYKALATAYSYLPKEDHLNYSYLMASDELVTPLRQVTPAVEMMRGKQTPNEPILSFWHGFNTQESLYRGINNCNILIDNIDLVPDMNEAEKEQWRAEGKFLKAYYHFLMFRNYGPIPIMDKNIPISAPIEELRQARRPVDEVVDYIVSTMDEAIEALPLRVSSNLNLGRVDKTIVAAIKSRVLLYAASPLFNGNSEYYSDFKNKDGEQLFNLSSSAEKWQKAMQAAEEAITYALASGVNMYNYNLPYPTYDILVQNVPQIQEMYNYRYMFTDKWNSEIIWGNSRPQGGWEQVQAASLMKNPNVSSNEAAWQWLGPSMRMVDTYYTENGLPIDQDLTFDFTNRNSVVTVTNDNILQAQPGQQTAKKHLNREPRFYASVGFDRGYNRSHDDKFSLNMRWNEVPGGRNGSSNDYLISGYILKKYNHPSASGATYDQLVQYAWPTIRLAELYLNYAEAANEFNGPSQEVFTALNEIRGRVGLPALEKIWSDASKCKSVGKHQSQEGLREIIKQERSIELAYEGHRYYDVRRWKEGSKYFSKPLKGWTVDEAGVTQFYVEKEVSIRSFISPRDYLQPIKLEELIKNPNLVQNPGW